MKQPNVLLQQIYQKLFDAFGAQHWWPGDTPFEIMVGAILTQNTNWGNVEKAIANLKKADCLTPQKLHTISYQRLTTLIKPSGFFNVKAKRLMNFLDFLFEKFEGNLSRMKKQPLETLRSQILAVNGIGPETADSILLYALEKPVFVVDAYTKRILSRHQMIPKDADYETVQGIFMAHLTCDIQLFNEYHALIVRVGKEYCKPRPRCDQCPLRSFSHFPGGPSLKLRMTSRVS